MQFLMRVPRHIFITLKHLSMVITLKLHRISKIAVNFGVNVNIKVFASQFLQFCVDASAGWCSGNA